MRQKLRVKAKQSWEFTAHMAGAQPGQPGTEQGLGKETLNVSSLPPPGAPHAGHGATGSGMSPGSAGVGCVPPGPCAPPAPSPVG